MADVMTDPVAPETPEVTGAFHAILVIEGERTTDHREFAPGSLAWRTLPLPLMWQQELSEGHKGAVVVGKITRIERRGSELHGWGFFDLGSANGKEAFRLVGEQIVRGISIDAELMEIDKEKLVGEEDGTSVLYVLEARIGAATLVSFPAFPSAVIALEGTTIPEADANGRGEAINNIEAALDTDPFIVTDKPWDGSASRFSPDEYARSSAGCRGTGSSPKTDCFLPHHEPDGTINRRAVHAAASRFNQVNAPAAAKAKARAHLAAHFRNELSEPVPDVLVAMALVAHAERPGPPSDWFDDPQLKGPTPLTVARNGRVYGHAALWESCHVGYKECMRAPRSRTNYAHFLIGQVFATGCDCDSGIPTGPITLGTGHADLYATADGARRHYDNTGMAVADVAVGEDAFGIWVAGSLRPGVTDAQVRALRGSALSGDWRYIGGSMELVGLLAVNVPGFNIPRVSAGIERDVQVSLVAAGIGDDELEPIEDGNGSGADPADLINELKREKVEKVEVTPDTSSPSPDDEDAGEDTSAASSSADDAASDG